MKASLTAAITLASAALPCTTVAFAPHAAVTTTTHSVGRCAPPPLRATLTADELATKSKSEQLQILGVEEEKLALGIDPDEVLEFLGT
jgi:hypothetical protein